MLGKRASDTSDPHEKRSWCNKSLNVNDNGFGLKDVKSLSVSDSTHSRLSCPCTAAPLSPTHTPHWLPGVNLQPAKKASISFGNQRPHSRPRHSEKSKRRDCAGSTSWLTLAHAEMGILECPAGALESNVEMS